MTIAVGQPGKASDFINKSQANVDPTQDAGRVPKLESNGKLSTYFTPQWEIIEIVTLGSPTDTIVFDNLDEYAALYLVARNNVTRASASATTIRAEVSINNGATWLTTNSYINGQSGLKDFISLSQSHGVGFITTIFRIDFFNTELPIKPVNSITKDVYVEGVVNPNPLNALKIYLQDVGATHRFDTGSEFYLYGHQ